MPLDFKNIAIPLVKGEDSSDRVIDDPSSPTRVVDGRFDSARTISRSEAFSVAETIAGTGHQLSRLTDIDGVPFMEKYPASGSSHVIEDTGGTALVGNSGFPYALRLGVDVDIGLGTASAYDMDEDSGYVCVATVNGGYCTLHMISRTSKKVLWSYLTATASLGRVRVVHSGGGFHLFACDGVNVSHYYVTASKPTSLTGYNFSVGSFTEVAFDAIKSETSGACNVYVHYNAGGTRYVASLRVTTGAFTTRATQGVSASSRISNVTVARAKSGSTFYDTVVFADSTGGGPPANQRISVVQFNESTGVVSGTTPALVSVTTGSLGYGVGQIVAQSHKVSSRWNMGSGNKVYLATTYYRNVAGPATTAVPVAGVLTNGAETVHVSYTSVVAFTTDGATATLDSASTTNLPVLYGMAAHASLVVDKTTSDILLPVFAVTAQTPTLHVVKMNNAHAGYFVAASINPEEFGFCNNAFPYTAGLLGASRCLPGLAGRDNELLLTTSKSGLQNVNEGTAVITAYGVHADTTQPTAMFVELSELVPLGDTKAGGKTTLAGAQSFFNNAGTLVESGLHHPPLFESPSTLVSPASFALAGTYRVCATWSFVDSEGRILESTPSLPVSVTIPTNFYSYLVAPKTPLTHAGLTLNVYRTTAGGSTFYLDSAVQTDPYSYGGGYYGLPDSTLVFRPQLYTQSQSRNAPAPPSLAVCEHQNRLFSTDGGSIRYTKEITAGYPVRWLPSTDRIEVPDTYGKATALLSMGERLVVFCERAIGVVQGEGPSLAGLDGSYSALQEVVPRYGVPVGYGRSVVRSADGAWFNSNVGLRLLTEQLSVARGEDGSEVGSFVDNTAQGSTYAIYLPDSARVVFQTPTTLLCYDEQAAAFTTMDPPSMEHARGLALYVPVTSAAWSLYVGSRDTVEKQQAGVYSIITGGEDPTLDSYSSMAVETGWLYLSSIQDMQRVTHLTLLGEVQGSHAEAVTVEAAYSHDGLRGAPSSESGWQTIATDVVLTPSTEANYVNAAWRSVRAEFHLPVQKCSVVKFRVTTRPADTAFVDYQTFRLSALTLRVGVKKGRTRPATRL